MRNLYLRPVPNRKFDFPIPSQAHNDQKSTRDHQQPNNNLAITYSNFITAEAMRSTLKQLTRVIAYNGDSDFDSDNNVEFVNIDLPCNKLSVRLLANDSISRIKKKRVLEMEDEANESLKAKVIQEKKTPIKRVRKKSPKALVPISGLVGKFLLDIQALLIKINIVIPTLHFFQISPRFCEETRRLMTVLSKLCKKKLCPLLF